MMLREVPFNSIQMATFYWLKDDVHVMAEDPLMQSAVLGLVAAGAAALATQPADTIKTRLMKADGGDENVASMTVKIWRASGLRGLYVGLGSRLLLVSLGGLIYFSTLAISGGEM